MASNRPNRIFAMTDETSELLAKADGGTSSAANDYAELQNQVLG